MFASMLGASLAFGAAVLAAAVYTEGALVALHTAAQAIGWFLAAAALAGLAGLRHAGFGQLGASGVALCAAAGMLYMAYFLDWHELPAAPIREAAAEPLAVRAEEPKALAPLEPRPLEAPAAVQRKAVAAASTPVPLPANSCSALGGVEALQCERCSDKWALARVACHEQVRLDYCESAARDERTCPSPIPSSYPG